VPGCAIIVRMNLVPLIIISLIMSVPIKREAVLAIRLRERPTHVVLFNQSLFYYR
jgi:hypothetical protein